jgi:hypothetical protein
LRSACARGPCTAGPFAPVQQAKLDTGCIGHPPHHAVHRIDLAHQVPFAQAADGRIAGHHPDAITRQRDKRGTCTHPRGRVRRFRPGMAAADHHTSKSRCFT